MDGQAILDDPFRNRGTAFTVEEREEYGLTGMLPIRVQTLEEQAAQTYAQFLSKDSDIEKRNFLMTVFNTNRVLFYRLMSEHLVEFMPIVYDPVIAQDIEHTMSCSSSRREQPIWISTIRKISGQALKMLLTDAISALSWPLMPKVSWALATGGRMGRRSLSGN